MSRQLRRQAQKSPQGPYQLADRILQEVARDARDHEDGRGIAGAVLMSALNTHYRTVTDLTKGTVGIQTIKDNALGTLLHMRDAMVAWLEKNTADLNEEIEQLKARIADLEQQTPEVTMPERKLPTEQYFPDGPLESASLCVYLKAQGIPATWDAVGVDHDGHLTDAHVEAWRAAYPTRAAMLAQLRAVVLPMMGRAA